MEGDTREVSSSRESLNCASRLARLLAVGVAEEVWLGVCEAGGVDDDCAKRQAAIDSQATAKLHFAKIRQ
jgi:hypothetical protein